ncbi:hypothetical protein ACFL0U_03300 [Pseudomonadota bacterium]
MEGIGTIDTDLPKIQEALDNGNMETVTQLMGRYNRKSTVIDIDAETNTAYIVPQPEGRGDERLIG